MSLKATISFIHPETHNTIQYFVYEDKVVKEMGKHPCDPPLHTTVFPLTEEFPFKQEVSECEKNGYVPMAILEEGEQGGERATMITGVMCNKCKATLPDHTMEQHLDINFMKNFHTCEKPKSKKRRTNKRKSKKHPTKQSESQCASIIFHNPETENYIWYYHREDRVIKEMGMNENTSNYITNLPIDYDVEHEKSINKMNGYKVFSQTE